MPQYIRFRVNVAKHEKARRTALARGAMNKRQRVGLQFQDWQIRILQELARQEGLNHVATLIHRDICKIYPTLKRAPGIHGASAAASHGASSKASP